MKFFSSIAGAAVVVSADCSVACPPLGFSDVSAAWGSSAFGIAASAGPASSTVGSCSGSGSGS